jgi:hypothetical protein
MLKVSFCAKQVDSLTASCQILMSKKDYINPPSKMLSTMLLTDLYKTRVLIINVS